MRPAGARILPGRVWVLRGKISSSPLATETMPASYVHEAEQVAGRVKVVVSADSVPVFHARGSSESTLSSGCPEHGRAERNGYTPIQDMKERK
jgi:hypothetical protein